MIINITIYGKTARYLGGKLLATENISLPDGAKVKDLYAKLGFSLKDVSYLFVNATLTDALGLGVALEDILHDGDHLGIFSEGYIWPYPYTDESVFSERLQKALAKRASASRLATAANPN